MDYLFINKEDVSLAFAKNLGLRYNLSVVHDDDVPRGWMFFIVNGYSWGKQYLVTADPSVVREGSDGSST